MFTVTIEKRHILAALKFAAVNDVRYYLNGLCIEAGATESRVIATDGHRLAVIRGTAPEYGAQGFGSVQTAIIPSEAFKGIKKAKKGEPDSIVVSVNAPDYQIQDGDTIRAGKLIDAKYPDWRRVCPASTTGVPQQFNAEYIGDMAAVAHHLGAKWFGCAIAHNGEQRNDEGKVIAGGSGAIVTIPGYPEFFSVVMAMRVLKDDEPMTTGAPEWITDNLQPEELAQAA